MPATLLDYIRACVVVDIDSNDHYAAGRHTDATHKFCDMTSNQAIVYGEAIKPEQNILLQKAVEACRTLKPQADGGQLIDTIIDHFVCHPPSL